jgi:hypothetical protein
MSPEYADAVNRLETHLLSLREQITELRELIETNALATRQQRQATQSGAQLFEQSEYWLDGEGRRLKSRQNAPESTTAAPPAVGATPAASRE